MVQSFKKAMQRKGVRSQEALLQRVEGELDPIYDLIYHVFGDETFAIGVLKSALKRALRRSKRERYERYLRLWMIRITVESIRRSYNRFLQERLTDQKVPLEFLPLEEKLALYLTDRVGLSNDDVASVLQVPAGRVGRSLVYAREGLAKEQGFVAEGSADLRERIALHRSLTGQSAYVQAMRAAQAHVREMPARHFSEIENSIRQQQLLPLLSRPEGVRWGDLSWQYKLGLEASLLGVVGLLAVVVLPWVFSQVNAHALVEGRFAEVFQVESQANSSPALAEITTDRLLASSENTEGENAAEAEAQDEFANMEFPSGDAFEAGTAPVAPSRQAAAVYRLIVQSASPQELIPQVRSLFAAKNVKERERSGEVMPGGVYFDGVTSVSNYPILVQEIQKLGQTKTYSHPGASRNPNERARVIVWVQQI